MAKLISFLVKPNGKMAKWLSLAFVIIILLLGGFGYLDTIIKFLDSSALTLKINNSTSISVYMIIKSVFIVVAMFWLTRFISDRANKSIKQIKAIDSSNRAILSKAFQIVLYFVAFLVLMDMLNIDLKTLTIFSGAIGIGIGFGLQKITSNFISGLILLFEKSIRTDDLIETESGIGGYVRYIGARHTLIETFDGKEVVVPNEDLITGKVTNWTYSHAKARVEISVGVSYNSDLRKVQEIMIESAKEHPKCINDPAPNCYLRTFNDNSVDFLLFFWIADIIDGRYTPQSEVMHNIWNKFKEHNIEIPFPQRDVYVKNIAEVKG